MILRRWLRQLWPRLIAVCDNGRVISNQDRAARKDLGDGPERLCPSSDTLCCGNHLIIRYGYCLGGIWGSHPASIRQPAIATGTRSRRRKLGRENKIGRIAGEVNYRPTASNRRTLTLSSMTDYRAKTIWHNFIYKTLRLRHGRKIIR
jgi:hypothetical protein